MKKVVSVISILVISLIMVGCSCMKTTAKGAVESFLDQYRNLSSSVITDMDEVVDKEKQYSDLKYEIIDESYDGDTAVVESKITVYDLYKVQKEATEYLNDNPNEFNDENGQYDSVKFMDYKLEQMKKNNDTVEYTIKFNLTKDENGNWQVTEISQDDLEKIHGIYNYESE